MAKYRVIDADGNTFDLEADAVGVGELGCTFTKDQKTIAVFMGFRSMVALDAVNAAPRNGTIVPIESPAHAKLRAALAKHHGDFA